MEINHPDDKTIYGVISHSEYTELGEQLKSCVSSVLSQSWEIDLILCCSFNYDFLFLNYENQNESEFETFRQGDDRNGGIVSTYFPF